MCFFKTSTRYIVILLILASISCNSKKEKILVFSKTEGFRHGSIESGVEALKKMGSDNSFEVVVTEDANFFTEESLQQFSAVLFLNTTGDVLNNTQQSDFERYIQAGGGFIGIHSATDTEYDWPWYNKLVGAYFDNHPKIQEASLNVLVKDHVSTKSLPNPWIKADEWYNFKDINPDIKVLIEIDETTYEGGTNGDHHPVSWFHEYDGGRAFYTAMGHTDETFANPHFINHLLGGIRFVIGNNRLNYDLAYTERIPDETRFIKKVLDFNLNEPMELDELPDRGILFVERRGAIKLFDFSTQQTRVLAQLDLFYGNEDGLLGLAIDPNYKENNWIYLFYSAPGDEPNQYVSRFDLKGDSLDLTSEKILLVIPTIRECCHSGGALEFGPKGNLFITLGDNTNPFESSGYAPIDERERRALWDAQKSAANTNDLRGKILRIKPEDDGTYSIPEGNLFPVGTPLTRPEIYVMGCRNPFRPSIDSKTGYLYWGDVGPDAGKDDSIRGPKGLGEFNQAREAGFWGWPYTRGNNKVYNDYNFTTKESGPKFDPNNLINDSPNNTGMKTLPPARESFAWYSYDESEEFPWLGIGGVNPMAGPVFHSSDYPNAVQLFPEYFENKMFLYEWMRDWIFIVTFDEFGNYKDANPFMSKTEFSHPMDMIFGSDGTLYLLEYGQSWNTQNMDARLSSVNYIPGNRNPIAIISTDRSVGAAPLVVQFNGSGSLDYDNDYLTYEWSFDKEEVQSKMINPEYTFSEPGSYLVKVKVADKSGETSEATTKILVGNDPPEMVIHTDPNISIYRDNMKINYTVVVKDNQDGNTTDGTINPDDVKVTFSYVSESEDIVLATIGHQQNIVPKGLNIIGGSDCKTCHAIDTKVNGPSYNDISEKYSKDDLNYLVSKVIKGGSGVWGETMMLPHPLLEIEEAEEIVKYILSLKIEQNDAIKVLPISGSLEFKEHLGTDNSGKYFLTASYLDKGNPELPESSMSVSNQLVFKPPKMEAEDADEKSDGPSNWNAGNATLVGSIVHNSYLRFEHIIFEDLESINFSAYYSPNYAYKGILEIREGHPRGSIIGSVGLEYFNEKEERMKYYNIPVVPTIDEGSLYLVFKNADNTDQYIANANWIILNYN